MGWVTEIYVVEFTRLYDDGSLVYVGRTIKNNLEDAKESARWMKDETYANGEREYVSVNLWRISHDDKKQYFIKWWEE